MFHTYVLRFAPGVIDIGRAQFLMDKDIARRGAEWLEDAWPDLEAAGASSREQAFFDWYCQRHVEKYGEPFRPDVDPDWS